MREFLDFLRAEWATLAGAPLTFVTLTVAAFGAAFLIARWRYVAIVETLRERLEGRNQTLEEYRERLHLVPARGSEYERLTHSELKSQALELVATLRNGLAECCRRENERSEQLFNQIREAKDDETRNRLHAQYTSHDGGPFEQLMNEYERNAKIKAILLRDEMMARGAGDIKEGHTLLMYEHPTNLFGIQLVADHLEALAQRLT